MSLRVVAGWIVCASVALFAAGAAQAQGIYLETTPVVLGESTAPGYENQIEITSVQFGMAKPCGTGSPSVSEITLSKTVDRSSVDLIAAAQAGTVFDTFVIRFTLATGSGVINQKTYTARDAVVTSVASSDAGSGSGGETFSVLFSEMTVEYRYVDAKGGSVPETVTIISPPCGF